MIRLWRSTPVRLTIVLGGAFLLLLILTGIVAYHLIQVELDSRLQQQLEQTFSVIAQSYGEGDIVDLSEVVQSNATANPGRERVFLLRDPAGTILAGNIDRAPDTTGLVRPSALGLTGDEEDYHLYSALVGGNRLVVGASRGEVEDIGEIVLSTLFWASVALLIAIFGAGTVLAVRGQRRLDSIAETMRRVGRGELDARIALTGNHDDIDDLSAQVNHALDRLAALLEGMRQVSVDIAHDLKTPLNRLSLILQNALRDAEAGRPTEDMLTEAVREGHQIAATFDALLRIAQIEAGTRRSQFTEVEIEALLVRVDDAYAEVAAENQQALSTMINGPLPRIVGDRDLLLQLLANLVENAIRHCGPDRVITLNARVTVGALVITVADNGPGIPEAERERVFQRLYRLDKSRTTSGHGLGLSLVKAVADLHGAAVSIEDNLPGTKVVVCFPLPPGVLAVRGWLVAGRRMSAFGAKATPIADPPMNDASMLPRRYV